MIIFLVAGLAILTPNTCLALRRSWQRKVWRKRAWKDGNLTFRLALCKAFCQQPWNLLSSTNIAVLQ
jgi:hypothetical protein